MKVTVPTLLACTLALTGVPLTASADTDRHAVVPQGEVKWGPGPASLPKGAEGAALYGDPSKEELFALRLKLPADYHIPPHTHPKPEIVTVISGTLRLGMGETADENDAQTLSAGSFFAMPPGMTHYVYVDEETVIQLNSSGPWNLTYVNPEDDPRKSQ